MSDRSNILFKKAIRLLYEQMRCVYITKQLTFAYTKPVINITQCKIHTRNPSNIFVTVAYKERKENRRYDGIINGIQKEFCLCCDCLLERVIL